MSFGVERNAFCILLCAKEEQSPPVVEKPYRERFRYGGSLVVANNDERRQIVVLSGTVFQEILIWQATASDADAPVLHRLKGHKVRRNFFSIQRPRNVTLADRRASYSASSTTPILAR